MLLDQITEPTLLVDKTKVLRNIERMAKKAEVTDWVTEQRKRKWQCAARGKNKRWTTQMLDWIPKRGERAVGGPAVRWKDRIVRFSQ